MPPYPTNGGIKKGQWHLCMLLPLSGLTIFCKRLAGFFQLKQAAKPSLAGLKILDIGCGGGLLAEPMARLGAEVTGIDVTAPAISAARTHAESMQLAIDYQVITAEDLSRKRCQIRCDLCL